MSRGVRSITRGFRRVVGGFFGQNDDDYIKEQRKLEEERIAREEKARKDKEAREAAEEQYRKQLESQKQAAIESSVTAPGIDETNVGLGDVKIDFGKLMSQQESDEDKLKKALK